MLVLCVAGIVIFGACKAATAVDTGDIKRFSAFIAMPGERMFNDNQLKKRIAEKIGAQADEDWLSWQTADEKIEAMIRQQEYPDFINGSEATGKLLEAGALVPLDTMLDNYPNLKAYLTDAQWESLRQADGHIYYIPPFGVYNKKDTAVMPSGEAFWIQKRVLEWAGFPKVATLDEYFKLIEAYKEANPVTDGMDTIGFEILCDDWRYFCLENPPMFLAGSPNDGCAIVDKETKTAHVYDTIPQAEQYYKKLSEMYSCGVIDPETFTLSYDQYLEKIKSGRVLGMVDQYWDFMSTMDAIYAFGKDAYTYVPLPIVADETVTPCYRCSEPHLNTGSGMGISISCRDVEGAMQFLNDLLDPEVMKLRYWGEEGVDYLVDGDGRFYQTPEMRAQRGNADWQKRRFCSYGYFPHYQGMLADGINTVMTSEQPQEYYDSLSEYDQKVLDAYGLQTWNDFLGDEVEGEPWYPLYSCLSLWSAESPYGKAHAQMETLKRQWLPQVIMAEPRQFEMKWKQYMKAYVDTVDVKAYEDELNAEIRRRIG